MKPLKVIGFSAICGAMCASGMLGSGTAVASSDYSGWTYKDAAQHISGQGQKAIIGTVVGDQLPTDSCMVASSTTASNLDSSGRSRGSAILLNLNCNMALASPGHPGNSSVTPQGKEAISELNAIAYMNKNPEAACPDDGKSITWCINTCQKWAGKCSADLVSYLGM